MNWKKCYRLMVEDNEVYDSDDAVDSEGNLLSVEVLYSDEIDSEGE